MSHLVSKVSVIQRIRNKAARALHARRFRRSVRHLHGPKVLPGGRNDVTVIALVKDGAYYIDMFLQHHRAIGARQFVFCDNGSTDGTLDRLKAEPDTTIIQSLLPMAEIESDFRRYAAEQFCRDRWCLYADMDERFTFEGVGEIGLNGLTNYLDQNNYTALMCQMLEMFSDQPVRATADLAYDRAVAAFQFCDLTHIEKRPYHDREHVDFWYYLRDNTVPSDQFQICFGGIRNKVFGERCCLTKHPLVFVGSGVEPGVHPHCAAHVACADVTGLIQHYKFANNPLDRDAASVRDATIPHGEDALRVNVLQNHPDVTLMTDTAQRFTGTDMLYRADFLIRSPRYSTYLADQIKP
jgi:hypothetical protein